jgi:hypothetical protein
MIMRLRRLLTVGSTVLATVLALAAPASAHTPILLDESDQVPRVAPLIVDGTDGISIFGTIPRRGAVRSAQFALTAGQPVSVTVAIPNKAPENTLAVADLPKVVLVAPDNSLIVLEPQIRVPAHDPELNLDFLVLRGYHATAVAGTYSVLVTSRAPSRFVVLTGIESEAFHGIKRGSVATDDQILHWYATAPY